EHRLRGLGCSLPEGDLEACLLERGDQSISYPARLMVRKPCGCEIDADSELVEAARAVRRDVWGQEPVQLGEARAETRGMFLARRGALGEFFELGTSESGHRLVAATHASRPLARHRAPAVEGSCLRDALGLGQVEILPEVAHLVAALGLRFRLSHVDPALTAAEVLARLKREGSSGGQSSYGLASVGGAVS